MDWLEKFKIYCDIYESRALNRGPDAINPYEAPLAYIRPLDVQVSNGGFWQFFYNSTGTFALETMDALRWVGAHQSAAFLSQAIQVYFRGQPIPFDTLERRRLMKEIDGDRTPEAGRLDDFYDLQERLDELVLKHAQKNEHHLRVYEDEVVTAQWLETDWRQCSQCCDAWQQPVAEKLSYCPACHALTFLRESV